MMDWFINLIAEHGPWIVYLILFLGSCVEGEMIVLFISALTYYGHLSLPWVMFTAFSGTLLADQLTFHIGKKYGTSLIKKYPSLDKPSKRVFWWLEKHDILFIMGFRFMYGVRVAGPIIIGSSGVSTLRFTLLNFPAAIVWAVLSCLAGHYLAHMIDTVVHNFSKWAKIFMVSFLGAALIGYVGQKIYLKYNPKSNDPQLPPPE